MSGQENAMRKFIKKYVKENIPGASCRQDHGNIYIVKGEADTYPCVVAHLDQVQTKHSPDFTTFEMDGKIFGFSGRSARQEGLGADDKNGIWVALKCLEHFDAIKVALFKEEEVGCGGSEVADMSFFTDCRFCLQADRRNGGDLITNICGPICSDAFIKAIKPFADDHGYKETSGMMTDVETLSDNGVGISCINISCGYYNPHTDEEYTNIVELENCLWFVMDIIESCTDVYPHERTKRFYGWNDDIISYNRSYGCYGRSGGVGYGYGGSSSLGKAWGGRYFEDDYPEDNSDNLFIPKFSDYPSADDAVWDFIAENYDNPNFLPYNHWSLISSECETYGFDYEDYCQIVQDVYECLDEEEWEQYKAQK